MNTHISKKKKQKDIDICAKRAKKYENSNGIDIVLVDKEVSYFGFSNTNNILITEKFENN